MMTLTQWERYFPDIGPNRAATKEKRVFLEVERGLSTRQREAFVTSIQNALTFEGETFLAEMTKVLGAHLRFGAEPLNWEGGSVTDLAGYVRLVFVELNHQRYVNELMGLVMQANSFSPRDADFFERPSGIEPGIAEGLTAQAV